MDNNSAVNNNSNNNSDNAVNPSDSHVPVSAIPPSPLFDGNVFMEGAEQNEEPTGRQSSFRPFPENIGSVTPSNTATGKQSPLFDRSVLVEGFTANTAPDAANKDATNKDRADDKAVEEVQIDLQAVNAAGSNTKSNSTVIDVDKIEVQQVKPPLIIDVSNVVDEDDDDEFNSLPYEGYQVKTAADYVQARPYIVSPPDAPIHTIPAAPAGSGIDRRVTHMPALVMGALCVLGFIICLSLGLSRDASCGMSICDKEDRSSTVQEYGFELFPLTAPLPAVLACLSGAFLCGAVLCFVLRLVATSSANSIPEAPLQTLFAHIRQALQSLVQTSALAVCAGLIVPLFLVVGITVRWTTAVAFLLGTLPGIAAVFLSLSVSTRVIQRTAFIAAEQTSKPVLSAFALLSRGAAVVPLASHTFAYAALVVTYLLLRDVNALVGFVFGGAALALGLHVVAGTYAAASNNSRQVSWYHTDDARSPQATVPSAGALAAGIGAYVSESCMLFAVPVVAATVLSTTLPYFENNPYAMCVFNHLAIDQACFVYTDKGGKQSFAVSLCRYNDFFTKYPTLTSRQATPIFIILPFVLGLQVLLSMVVSAIAGLRKPRDARGRLGIDVRSQVTLRLLRPFFKVISIDQMVRLVLATVMYLIIVIVTVGPGSEFARANSTAVERYALPASRGSSVLTHDLCRITANENDGLPPNLYPTLNLISGEQYRPLNSFGTKMPRPSRIAWFIFGCLEVGLLCGFFMSFVAAYQSSAFTESAKWARILATDEIDGEVSLSTGGGAIGGAINGLILAAGLCFCHQLFDAYGVALGAIGIMSSLGPSAMLCAIGQMSKDVRRVCTAVGVNLQGRRRAALLAAAGETTSAWGKGGITATATMGALALLWVLAVQAGIASSAVKVAGGPSATEPPTRHVTNVESVNLDDMNTLGAMFLGAILPMILGAGVAAASAASATACGTAVRREMLRRGAWEASAEGPYQPCHSTTLRVALVGSVAPALFALLITCSGMWFGTSEWISMVIGCTTAGIVLTFVTSIVGRRLHAVSLLLNVNADMVEGNEEVESEDVRFRNRMIRFDRFTNRGVGKIFEDYYYGQHNAGAVGSTMPLTMASRDYAGDDQQHVQAGGGYDGGFWKWDEVGEEWISGCIRVFVIFVVVAAVVSCQTNAVKQTRWWLAIVMVVVWTAVFCLGRVTTSWLIGKVEGDAVFKVEENSARVNVDAASPFVQQGPCVDLDKADAESLLRRAGSKNAEDLGPIIM